MRKYFDCSDDFFYIINSHIKNVKNIRHISTGWTNFVYEVLSPSGEYIFRFPRNDFFADAIVKECNFVCDIEKDKLSFSLPNLQLCYHKNRPFSMHKKLIGTPLAQCNLSENEVKNIAADICKFLKEFQSLNVKIPLEKCSQFLQKLSLIPENFDLNTLLPLIEAEKKPCVLSHGDFNPGNILISNGKMVGVIDFAFVSFSSQNNDIARLLGRVQSKYRSAILKEYQNFFGEIDEDEIKNLTKVWNYVDNKYIEYIKKYHREIELTKN